MKKMYQGCFDRKHCKCARMMRFILGAGILGLLLHIMYGWIDPDKKNALNGRLHRLTRAHSPLSCAMDK